MFNVTVPPDVLPGQHFEFVTPDGRRVRALAPMDPSQPVQGSVMPAAQPGRREWSGFRVDYSRTGQGCGYGASMLQRQHDLEKGEHQVIGSRVGRATWREWARLNDVFSGGSQTKCGWLALCAYFAAIKWLVVLPIGLAAFILHIVFGLCRWCPMGALHMMTRKMCFFRRRGTSPCVSVYYFFGSVPMLFNYLFACVEVVAVGGWCYSFAMIFVLCLTLNPVTAVEAVIEMIRVSDWVYGEVGIFANLCFALQNPFKLLAPCWCGEVYIPAAAAAGQAAAGVAAASGARVAANPVPIATGAVHDDGARWGWGPSMPMPRVVMGTAVPAEPNVVVPGTLVVNISEPVEAQGGGRLSLTEELERLTAWRDNGMLTSEEFEERKRRAFAHHERAFGGASGAGASSPCS